MGFNADTVTHHQDVGKHSGTAAETLAKKHGLGMFAKEIGEFVKKLVGKRQKEYIDSKNTAKPVDAAAAPAAAPAAQPAPVAAA
ncbi:hypothetical protein EJ04DRAFT_509489 [Polyplosphaeria fusca]|uniref:Uncharacterized protein n=1 Tax=Polyplosphaeria fusca TaxID=682080 RepID=A0A9P4R3S8_9PLEO|nr:hypothetical protein EJ04DRAFT_509489 [Polyplosphaeria fusca]